MLPATNIPWKEITTINRKLTNVVLPKLGFNRHFPRVVLTAPSYFGGLDLLRLAFEQGLAHTLSLIQHIRAQTHLGIIFIQVIEAYHLQSGFFNSPLHYTANITYVNTPWLDTVRDFLHRIQGHIKLYQIKWITPL
jgi:hypothetical protein